ncbi:MAG: hypothetical protein DRJ49_00420 [Thermoprotei archaeon]|nr:MAG: hypothetical protein DRN53_01275 [Thermoprotei archaeon]RLE90273.1 MAG: hypothetical protein DRJ49_00420 [Thermoprotei archaeon]
MTEVDETKLMREILDLIDSRTDYDESVKKLAKDILITFKREGKKGVEKIINKLIEGISSDV